MLSNNLLPIKRRLFNFVYTIYPENKECEENTYLFFDNLKKEKVQNILNDIETYLKSSNIKYKKEFKYYKRFTFKDNVKAFKIYILKQKLIIYKNIFLN